MTEFSEILSSLRKEKNLSQRQAAAELGVSQALLSHYENGLREPRLEFVIKACDYYGVTADYILGRDKDIKNTANIVGYVEELRRLTDSMESALLNNNSKR